MSIFGFDLSTFLTPERISLVTRVAMIVMLGFPFVLMLSRWARTVFTNRLGLQQGMITGKVIRYTGIVILLVSILHEFGFQLGALLGAAGIVGIAVGFASQTSVSNVISGVFLIAEQPFKIGDIIRVGTTVGEVLSIDILSIKIRTFENQFVRIPNENILKSEVTTITRFPVRRVDLQIGVAYKEDLERVKKVLLSVAHDNPLCLQEPAPLFIHQGFGESSVNYVFAVWAASSDWLTVRNTMYEGIKRRFDEEGIEIPFPHRTVYTGAITQPFPVQMVDGGPGNGAGA